MSMLAPCKSLNWPCSGSPSSTIELKPPEIKSRNWGKYTKNKDKGGTRAEWEVRFALLCELEGLQSKDDHVVMSFSSHPASKGAVEAAHFCYLMADIPFGYYGAKTDRMALLGSSHR